MSVVWRGYDEVLGRQVAVKVLAAEFAGDVDFRARLRHEARAVARLSHPHITNVYDYGEADNGTPFLVMELVEGESLADRLVRGPLPFSAVVEIGAQVAGALSAAHDRGLVHEDIKPANVMLCATGAKVVDFGIAALAGERRGPMVVGTPSYMAPEQRAGAPATPATDVYALGLVLSGALRQGEPVPPGLSVLLADCLQRSPDRRPPSSSVAARFEALRGAMPPGRARVATPPRVLPPVPVGSGGTRIMPVPPRASRWPLFAGVTVLLVIACVVGLALANGGHPGSPAAGPSTAPANAGRPPSPTPKPTPKLVCRVDYKMTDLAIGFSAQLTLNNTGTTDIYGWTLTFDLPDNQEFKGGWGANWTHDGNRMTGKDWGVLNARIKPGASVDVSLYGTSKGKARSPKSFTLNDVRCGGGAG
jgi:serine/threonine-protein kinase